MHCILPPPISNALLTLECGAHFSRQPTHINCTEPPPPSYTLRTRLGCCAQLLKTAQSRMRTHHNSYTICRCSALRNNPHLRAQRRNVVLSRFPEPATDLCNALFTYPTQLFSTSFLSSGRCACLCWCECECTYTFNMLMMPRWCLAKCVV